MITNKPRDLWSFVSLRFHNLLVNLCPNDFEFDGLTLEQFQKGLGLSERGEIYKESNVYFDCKNLKIVLVKDFDKERFPINQYIPVSNCFGMRYNWTFEEAIEIFQKELLDIEKNLSVQNFSDFSQINQYDFIDLRTPFGHIYQDKSSDEKTYIFSMFHPDFWLANNKYREVYGDGRYHTIMKRFPNFLDTIQHINVNQLYHSTDEYDRTFEWLYKKELEKLITLSVENKHSRIVFPDVTQLLAKKTFLKQIQILSVADDEIFDWLSIIPKEKLDKVLLHFLFENKFFKTNPGFTKELIKKVYHPVFVTDEGVKIPRAFIEFFLNNPKDKLVQEFFTKLFQKYQVVVDFVDLQLYCGYYSVTDKEATHEMKDRIKYLLNFLEKNTQGVTTRFSLDKSNGVNKMVRVHFQTLLSSLIQTKLTKSPTLEIDSVRYERREGLKSYWFLLSYKSLLEDVLMIYISNNPETDKSIDEFIDLFEGLSTIMKDYYGVDDIEKLIHLDKLAYEKEIDLLR